MADKYTEDVDALPVEKRDKGYWRSRLLFHKAASEAAVEKPATKPAEKKKKPTLSEEMESDPAMRRILGLPALQAKAVEK